MYWDHGYGMGLGWIPVVLLGLLVLGALAATVVLVVKAVSGSNAPPHHGPGSAQPPARAIAEERLARGELTPDEFREIVRALEDGAGRSG
ncbi:SHOCT domain-containing protein [Agromyces arachidis]|uniref:SHOCT domain-containing protein n=1 Tax=Agromyces arachidis TaxID=766966 RepID=UPI004055C3F2